MRTQTAPAHHARSLSQVRGEAHIPPRGHSLTPGHPPLPTVLVNGNHNNNNTTNMGFLSGNKQPPPAEAPPPDNGGKVVASDSIINQVADSSKSLFQVCVKLRQRLAEVPGFQPHLDEMETEAAAAEDPMTAMWKCLKKGYPLLTVYNALEPAAPIEIDPAKVVEAKRPIAAAFKFSEACKTHLNFPSEECFLIKDLHGDDTTGFVKVIAAVSRVLDILQSKNLLLPPAESQSPSAAPETTHKKTRRDYIIGELVDTERKYVQHLESLQQFKVAVEEKGEVPGDKVHAIFLNLNALLDFQRRFLIRIETLNSLPEAQQNWGQLFTQSQDSFRVYEPYIANQQHGEEQAMLEFDKLHNVGHQIAADRATLSGFLTKPFQRLSKYPLLLKELRDKCEAEEHIKDDLSAGMTAAISILERANAAIDKEQRHLAVDELSHQVDDWKGHNLEQFGELLLYGTFAVVKTDGKSDIEKDYRIYLFERILLCCKELNPAKQKNNFMAMNRPPTDRKAKPRMQLKGRIFMQNVTETLSLQKPGSYTVQIFWKGDPGVENFVIRFNNEEVMRKWYAQVEVQRKTFASPRGGKEGSHHGSSTSDTEFAWVKNQGVPTHNPYKQDDEGNDDDGDDHHNEKQRGSTTNSLYHNWRAERMGGGPSSSYATGIPYRPPTSEGQRIPPPRFPLGNNIPPPHLTLHTQIPTAAVPSPAERAAAAASYFSPTGESPNSTRASSSSGMFPFPRQVAPIGHWPSMMGGEESNRFTAPVMGRATSREGPPPTATSTSTSSGSAANGRPTNTRPSLPAMASQNMPAAALAQNRLRSASSPDIHNHGVAGRRLPNGEYSTTAGHYHQAPPIPDVPPFPAHVAYKKNNMINRSHTNSPVEGVGVPRRSGTASPGILQQQRERERERLLVPGGGAGGYGNQYPHPSSSNYPGENNHPYQVDPRMASTSPSGTPTPSSNSQMFKSPPTPFISTFPSVSSPQLSSAGGSINNSNNNTSPSIMTITTTNLPSTNTNNNNNVTLSSPTAHSPTQLKVKVSFESNYVTLVVATNISYQSLVDRIDAKLSRFTALAIGRGTIRLRYRDEDGDFVTIRSDEDIQLAFSDWREQMRVQMKEGGMNMNWNITGAGGGGGGLGLQGGQLGEIQLFCQPMDG
ncbi:MAG: hypothetical protein M1823_004044 [Watsoniomyces obsoletus]|nr:MAG: hypothetical protein M1823_004044 [Watsoniomyces obsoletus]